MGQSGAEMAYRHIPAVHKLRTRLAHGHSARLPAASGERARLARVVGVATDELILKPFSFPASGQHRARPSRSNSVTSPSDELRGYDLPKMQHNGAPYKTSPSCRHGVLLLLGHGVADDPCAAAVEGINANMVAPLCAPRGVLIGLDTIDPLISFKTILCEPPPPWLATEKYHRGSVRGGVEPPAFQPAYRSAVGFLGSLCGATAAPSLGTRPLRGRASSRRSLVRHRHVTAGIYAALGVTHPSGAKIRGWSGSSPYAVPTCPTLLTSSGVRVADRRRAAAAFGVARPSV